MYTVNGQLLFPTINGLPALYNIMAGGTWTAADTWTIPAVTLGGAVAGGDQAFTNVGDMTFAAGSIIASGSTNGNTLLFKANDTTFITLTTGATDTMQLEAFTLNGTVTGGSQVINGLGMVYIGDTANALMTLGLTINCAGNDNEILAFKSSDTTHGMTSVAEADTFARFQKYHATEGGIEIAGFSSATCSIGLDGCSTTDNTTKSTGGSAVILFTGWKVSGASVGAVGANANVFGVRNATTTVFLVDAEGDIWANGGITAAGALTGITNAQFTPASGAAVNVGVSANFKRFYSEITLATDNAETDVGLTPAAVILSAAIRVSVEITGLDEADHHIQLGINGTASKYIDVAQGAAATTISVNKKGKYTFDPTTDTEAAALKLTITGGADQIPTAGKVYVEVIYLDSTNLADV